MNTHRILGLSTIVVAAASFSAAAGAQELTRAQVTAELHAAQAAGAVPHGDLDITASRGADDAPARGDHSDESRAQVKAELAKAQKDGDIPFGETGRTMAEINPSDYPPVPGGTGLTRAQVRAELAEAQHLGDVEFGETGRTLAEIYPERYAAVRAEAASQYARAHSQQHAATGQVATK
jgi:hypothetical protein